MSDVAFSYWWKFKNELPYNEERIWSEYVNDKEAFERKILLRKNKLMFAMGFLETNVDSSSHMGYIQFDDSIGWDEVVNVIGIKKMLFTTSTDMSEHVNDFLRYCLERKVLFYNLSEPHESNPGRREYLSVLPQCDADEGCLISDVYEDCVGCASSTASDTISGSSAINSDRVNDEGEELTDTTENVDESTEDESLLGVSSISSESRVYNPTERLQVRRDGIIDESTEDESLSGVSSISSYSRVNNPTERLQVRRDGIVEVEVVDLTNEDTFEVDLANDESLQADLANDDAHLGDLPVADEESIVLSFRDMRVILDRNLSDMRSKRPNHAYRFFIVSVELIERTPFSRTNLEGVYHERFQDTRNLLHESFGVIDSCSSCLDHLSGQVVAHHCFCGKWNINHWVCFKTNFATHLRTHEDSYIPSRYHILCDSCRSPIFRNHSYLSTC
jgi:hypothetical protein